MTGRGQAAGGQGSSGVSQNSSALEQGLGWWGGRGEGTGAGIAMAHPRMPVLHQGAM